MQKHYKKALYKRNGFYKAIVKALQEHFTEELIAKYLFSERFRHTPNKYYIEATREALKHVHFPLFDRSNYVSLAEAIRMSSYAVYLIAEAFPDGGVCSECLVHGNFKEPVREAIAEALYTEACGSKKLWIKSVTAHVSEVEEFFDSAEVFARFEALTKAKEMK